MTPLCAATPPFRLASALLLGIAIGSPAYAATGDIDGDGRDEVLLRHEGNAAWVYYDIEDGVGTRREFDLDLSGGPHNFVAVGDLNGDGRDDLLFRADDTHAWFWRDSAQAAAEPGEQRHLTRNPLFVFQATGDFDGDGRDDVLLRNSSTGKFVYYENAARRTGGLGRHPPPPATGCRKGLTL